MRLGWRSNKITTSKALRESLGIRPETVLEVAAVLGELIAQKREAEDPLLKWRGRGRLPWGETVDAYLAHSQVDDYRSRCLGGA